MRNKLIICFIFLLIAAIIFPIGCKSSLVSASSSQEVVQGHVETEKPDNSNKTGETDAAKAKTGLKSLDIYVWEGYLPQKAVEMFEKETGIKLNISLTSDNGTMITLLEGGGKADIIMPTQNQVNRMYEQNLAQPLDLNKIPNYINVGDSFKNLSWSMWDGSTMGLGDTYAIPYVFGTSGLIINKNKYKGYTDSSVSWNILFDESLKRRTSSKDSAESIMICLDLAGIPRSDLLLDTDDTLRKVREKLIELKNNVLKFYSTGAEIMDLLKNEEVWVSHMWDGGGRKLMAADPKFIYVLPETGGMGWADTFMIPANADNPDGAVSFINFMLRQDVAALVTAQGNTTTINGALEMSGVENMDMYKFTDTQLKNLTWQLNFPENVVDAYTSFWEEISASG